MALRASRFALTASGGPCKTDSIFAPPGGIRSRYDQGVGIKKRWCTKTRTSVGVANLFGNVLGSKHKSTSYRRQHASVPPSVPPSLPSRLTCPATSGNDALSTLLIIDTCGENVTTPRCIPGGPERAGQGGHTGEREGMNGQNKQTNDQHQHQHQHQQRKARGTRRTAQRRAT